MEKYRVGVIGATGMVGQRFVSLMETHPWFQLVAVAASSRSAGKTYEEVVSKRWAIGGSIPEEAKGLVVLDAEADAEKARAYAELLYSQALLIAGLPLDDPSGYTDLVCGLMK